MKNKSLAIFGIGSYVLSVIASASDLEGNPSAPIVVIALSGIAKIVFILMAMIRLWKETKYLSILLVSSAIILFALTAIQEFVAPEGNLVILLLNITKVINLIAYVYAIIKLFTLKDLKTTNKG